MNFENYDVGIKNCAKNNRGGKRLVSLLKQASSDAEVSDLQFSGLIDAAMQTKHAAAVQWFFEVF